MSNTLNVLKHTPGVPQGSAWVSTDDALRNSGELAADLSDALQRSEELDADLSASKAAVTPIVEHLASVMKIAPELLVQSKKPSQRNLRGNTACRDRPISAETVARTCKEVSTHSKATLGRAR